MTFRNFLIVSLVILTVFSAGFYYFYSQLYRGGLRETNTVSESEMEQRNTMYETLARLKTDPAEFDEKKSLETLKTLQKGSAASSEEEMLKKLNELKANNTAQ